MHEYILYKPLRKIKGYFSGELDSKYLFLEAAVLEAYKRKAVKFLHRANLRDVPPFTKEAIKYQKNPYKAQFLINLSFNVKYKQFV